MCPPFIPGGPNDPRMALVQFALCSNLKNLQWESSAAAEDLALCDKARKVCVGADTPAQIRVAKRYVFFASRVARLGHAEELLRSCEELLREREGEYGATTEH